MKSQLESQKTENQKQRQEIDQLKLMKSELEQQKKVNLIQSPIKADQDELERMENEVIQIKKQLELQQSENQKRIQEIMTNNKFELMQIKNELEQTKNELEEAKSQLEQMNNVLEKQNEQNQEIMDTNQNEINEMRNEIALLQNQKPEEDEPIEQIHNSQNVIFQKDDVEYMNNWEVQDSLIDSTYLFSYYYGNFV